MINFQLIWKYFVQHAWYIFFQRNIYKYLNNFVGTLYTLTSQKDINLSNTGLDPAFPLFYPSACHIRSTDAEAVVILHTDGGFYGVAINTGTVDFYANKGISVQPGCPIIFGAGKS